MPTAWSAQSCCAGLAAPAVGARCVPRAQACRLQWQAGSGFSGNAASKAAWRKGCAANGQHGRPWTGLCWPCPAGRRACPAPLASARLRRAARSACGLPCAPGGAPDGACPPLSAGGASLRRACRLRRSLRERLAAFARHRLPPSRPLLRNVRAGGFGLLRRPRLGHACSGASRRHDGMPRSGRPTRESGGQAPPFGGRSPTPGRGGVTRSPGGGFAPRQGRRRWGADRLRALRFTSFRFAWSATLRAPGGSPPSSAVRFAELPRSRRDACPACPCLLDDGGQGRLSRGTAPWPLPLVGVGCAPRLRRLPRQGSVVL